MDYIRTDANGQLTFIQSTGFLMIPSCLYGFVNESTSTGLSASGRTVIRFSGSLKADNEDLTCSCCGIKMHVNNHPGVTMRHLPFGGYLSDVSFTRTQYACPGCGSTWMQYASFKAAGHRITVELHQYVCDLLACGTYTNKEVAELAGLGQNVVKAIDKERLQGIYATPDGKLVKTEKHAKFLGIDEFKRGTFESSR